MEPERKTVMISARLPASLVARVDFVTRNTHGDICNRSLAVEEALKGWLPDYEKELETLGVLPKKAR